MLVVFGASFLGAFEITLPSSLANKLDANSDKGGLAGIFFMAATLGSGIVFMYRALLLAGYFQVHLQKATGLPRQ
jgi:hypothetical protein